MSRNFLTLGASLLTFQQHADAHEDANESFRVSGKIWSHEKGELHCPDRDLITPCTFELKQYLQKKDAEMEPAAFDCVNRVYETNDDFWVLKNMTHLLLDLDTSDHNFDGVTKDNKWIRLGLDFSEKLRHHETCMGEFDTKSPLECRCVPLYGKVSMLKLKNAGKYDEAEALFNELTKLEWNGKVNKFAAGEAIPWEVSYQTPQIFMPGLKSEAVWGEDRRKDLPIWDVLEDNFEMIRDEINTAIEDPASLDPTYRFLFQGGNWTQILLYHDREFTDKCTLMPKTCELLKKELPKRSVHHLPWTSNQNEQVLVLKMAPGTDVEWHCGPANNILNVHLGVSGVENAKLLIADKEYGWEVGKVIAWDGSYDHRVHCLECKEDRVIMMVRYMHPDVTKENYEGSVRTQYEKIPWAVVDEEDILDEEEPKVQIDMEKPPRGSSSTLFSKGFFDEMLGGARKLLGKLTGGKFSAEL